MYDRILVPLDGSPNSETVVGHAIQIGTALKAEVELFRVFNPSSPVMQLAPAGADWDRMADEMAAEADSYLKALQANLHTENVRVTRRVDEGYPASTIVAEAESGGRTLVTMATHARSGVARGLIGSVTDDVLRTGRSPMLVVKGSEGDGGPSATQLDTMVITLDGSDLAEEVLEDAIAIALGLDLKVSLLTVLPVTDPFYTGVAEHTPESAEAHDRAVEYLERVRVRVEKAGISLVGQVVLHGMPAEAIVDLVDNLPGALVAMTTHGWSGIGRWLLGSVADRVIRYSDRPVLLVRAGAAPGG